MKTYREYWVNVTDLLEFEVPNSIPVIGIGAVRELQAQLQIAIEALEFIKSRTVTDPLGVEELNCRAARVYDRASDALDKINKIKGT